MIISRTFLAQFGLVVLFLSSPVAQIIGYPKKRSNDGTAALALLLLNLLRQPMIVSSSTCGPTQCSRPLPSALHDIVSHCETLYRCTVHVLSSIHIHVHCAIFCYTFLSMVCQLHSELSELCAVAALHCCVHWYSAGVHSAPEKVDLNLPYRWRSSWLLT